MIEILGWILLIGSTAAVIVVEYFDFNKSNDQRLHLPPSELNWFARAKDGYFDPKRSLIFTIAGIALGWAIAFAIPRIPGLEFLWLAKFIVALVFTIWAVWIWITIKKDIKNRDENLAKQKLKLERLAEEQNPDLVATPTLKAFKGKGHVFVSGTFYDFHEETGIPNGEAVMWDPIKAQEAKAKIAPRLLNLAKLPQSEWFDEDRAKKV